MLYDIIPIVIIIASLVVIAVILGRKFFHLATVNTDQIPKEQQIEVKKSLLESKLQRKLRNLKGKIPSIPTVRLDLPKVLAHEFRRKIAVLEEKYKGKQRELIRRNPVLARQKIKFLFEEGDKLSQAENLAGAEKKYIEIIKLDAKNILAYRSLGYIYLKQKDFGHAKEIFDYNLKLCLQGIGSEDGAKSQATVAYRDLGLAHKAAEEYDLALENFGKAAEIEPNNPKNLDLLIEMNIILKDKWSAERNLEKLREVNPENQKIAEFEEQVNSLAS